MRHKKHKIKISRKRLGQRRSFIRNLSGELLQHGKIETTLNRAKAIQPRVERFITIAKKQNLGSFRLLLSKLPKKSALKLFY